MAQTTPLARNQPQPTMRLMVYLYAIVHLR